MANFDNLNVLMRSIKDQYGMSHTNKLTDADKLIEYANFLCGGSALKIWDDVVDNDRVMGNHISSERYMADGKNILFQSQADQENKANIFTAYDVEKGEMKTLTDKKDIAAMLDQMDGTRADGFLTDSKGKKISINKFLSQASASVKLTKDGFELVGVSNDTDLGTSASGDPHYYIGSQHVFDHQGIQGEEYTELNSDEMQIISKRGAYMGGAATVIVDEAISLKGSNLTVVAHANGTYDVYDDKKGPDANGKYTPLSEDAAKTRLKDAGIEVTKNGSDFSVKYMNRTAKLQLNGTYINDYSSSREDDTGIRAEASNVYLTRTDADKDGAISIDTDGNSIISEEEINNYTYDKNDQNFVFEGKTHSSYNSSADVEAAIRADLAKIDTDGTIDGKLNGNKVGLASAFTAGHGYTEADFNEFLGKLLYSADSKYF